MFKKHTWVAVPLIALVLVGAIVLTSSGNTSLAAQMEQATKTVENGKNFYINTTETLIGSTNELNALYTAMAEVGATGRLSVDEIPTDAPADAVTTVWWASYTVEDIGGDECVFQTWDQDHMTPSEHNTRTEDGNTITETAWNCQERDPWYTSTSEAEYYSASAVAGEKSTSKTDKYYKVPYGADASALGISAREHSILVEGCKNIKKSMEALIKLAAANSGTPGTDIVRDPNGTYHWGTTHTNGLKESNSLSFGDGNRHYILETTYEWGPAKYICTNVTGLLAEGYKIHIPTGDEIVFDVGADLEPLPTVG